MNGGSFRETMTGLAKGDDQMNMFGRGGQERPPVSVNNAWGNRGAWDGRVDAQRGGSGSARVVNTCDDIKTERIRWLSRIDDHSHAIRNCTREIISLTGEVDVFCCQIGYHIYQIVCYPHQIDCDSINYRSISDDNRIIGYYFCIKDWHYRSRAIAEAALDSLMDVD
ncbi:unnamed protein product [Aspergillus oryzae var. brunneus]|uniref:Unnamed protein product n=2 Tax=Aspergillus oryzae TaxID=5062 RepID=A0AAN5BWY0_ASPOZ|nr:unnamed protein product [Aspergillus oryzae]GMG43528.1 unnamed protein product [Aspergillus oryzae var. brunneus]